MVCPIINNEYRCVFGKGYLLFVVLLHLFSKLPQPGDSKVTFAILE